MKSESIINYLFKYLLIVKTKGEFVCGSQCVSELSPPSGSIEDIGVHYFDITLGDESSGTHLEVRVQERI